MQSTNNAARVNFCLRRASALLREVSSNSRQLHVTQGNIQRPSAALPSDAKPKDLSIEQRLRQQVATDGLRTFIEKVTAKPKEARMWLKYFKSRAYWDESQAFCVLFVNEDVFYNSKILETFGWSAAFLMQNKMKPIIVFGMKRRVKENMQDIENKLEIMAARLQKILNNHGVESGLYMGNNQLLYTEESKKLSIDVSTLKESLLTNQIPIVTNFLDDGASKPRLYDPMRVAEMITKETKPMKLMLLGCEKGIRDDAGKVISDIVLPFDLPTVLQSNEEDAKKKIERVSNLLETLPPESSVIMTSADTVIQELFTHHGSGTMIKRSEKVVRLTSIDQADINDLSRLISESFRKPLPETYFDEIRDSIDSIYVSEGYSAAAIILRDQSIPVPYLDKFAVQTSSQGFGLTTQMWTEIVKDYPQLFWRAKSKNREALGWYNTVCQGSWKDDPWIVFWYGLQSCRDVFPLIDFALKKKETFASDSTSTVGLTLEDNIPSECNSNHSSTPVRAESPSSFVYPDDEDSRLSAGCPEWQEFKAGVTTE